MSKFEPDYNHLIDAANNIEPKRIPLYDHNVDAPFLSKVFGVDMLDMATSGKPDDLREYMRKFCGFFLDTGYDTVSFECCIGAAMPGSGSLSGHKPGEIQNREDFEKYPWGKIEENFFRMYTPYFDLLREYMPPGMKAVGGVGNGVFECVQEITGYQNLCLISYDDPQLYAELFSTVGDINAGIWKRFMETYRDIYAVMRFGDDLGYKSSSLLSAEDIRKHVIPQYRKITDIVHSYDMPFLLHTCGCIFNVMDDIIEDAKIDAKHSNEDAIAPFTEWIERYGDRIGNFGGIDMDVICRQSPEQIRAYTLDILEKSMGHGGVAFGSGNSIPHYVPVEGYYAMTNTIREFRGDK
jgi:uroporphyrinogen decarboxylase